MSVSQELNINAAWQQIITANVVYILTPYQLSLGFRDNKHGGHFLSQGNTITVKATNNKNIGS